MVARTVFPAVYFSPINGTYQNYNVVRRLLTGEIPCLDFVAYLGMGHLYLGSALAALLGGNLLSSVISYQLLTTGSLFLLVFALGSIYSHSARRICYAFMLILPLVFCLTILTAKLFPIYPLDELIQVANSARMVRAMILYIDVLLLYYLENSRLKNKILYIGLIAGGTICYSNDYGIATALSIIFLTIYRSYADGKNIFISSLLLSISTLIGLIATAAIVTQGHPTAWFLMNSSIGDFQTWYFNGEKCYYIYQFDINILTILQFIFVLFCLYSYFHKREYSYLALALINTASFLVAQEAHFLSGGGATIAHMNLILSVLYYFFLSHECFWQKKYTISTVYVCVVLFLAVSAVDWHKNIAKNQITISQKAQEHFGCGIGPLEQEVLNAAEITKGAPVFSTYASALEDYTNQFQPSGYDYIIHVLGKTAREKYMHSFQNDNFEYVTIQREYSPWSYWMRNANWFFYRELYAHYTPVYANFYELFFKKVPEDLSIPMPDNTQIIINKQNESLYSVEIFTDTNINGTADVMLDYKIDLQNNWRSKLVFRRDLDIIETTQNEVAAKPEEDLFRNFKLAGSGQFYVPITIKNGHGQILLQANPKKEAILQIINVDCKHYFQATT